MIVQRNVVRWRMKMINFNGHNLVESFDGALCLDQAKPLKILLEYDDQR